LEACETNRICVSVEHPGFYRWDVAGHREVDGTMSTGERYQVRVRISMLYREANLFEDRASEAGRMKAAELRREANDLNEGLRRKQ
jgi:hypothetical protein